MSLERSWKSMFCRDAAKVAAQSPLVEESIQPYLDKAGYPDGWDDKGIFQLMLEEEGDGSSVWYPHILTMKEDLMNTLNEVTVELSLNERLKSVFSTLCSAFIELKADSGTPGTGKTTSIDGCTVEDFESQLGFVNHLQEIKQLVEASKKRNVKLRENISLFKEEEVHLDSLFATYRSKLEVLHPGSSSELASLEE